MGYLNLEQLANMGFARIGRDVKISDKASLYGCGRISIGDNVRIDDFCVLSAGEGEIEIGNHIHIAVQALIIGGGKITLSDFSGISSRVSVYSSNDDYSGASLTNPTIPAKFTNVTHKDVFVGRHVIIGSGSIVLPGAVLEDGVAVGALSLVKGTCDSFGTYVGNPAKKIRDRKRDLLALEQEFLKVYNAS